MTLKIILNGGTNGQEEDKRKNYTMNQASVDGEISKGKTEDGEISKCRTEDEEISKTENREISKGKTEDREISKGKTEDGEIRKECLYPWLSRYRSSRDPRRGLRVLLPRGQEHGEKEPEERGEEGKEKEVVAALCTLHTQCCHNTCINAG